MCILVVMASTVLWGCGAAPRSSEWSSLVREGLRSDEFVAEVVWVALERPWVYVACARDLADAFLRARDAELKDSIGRTLERVLAYCGEEHLEVACRVFDRRQVDQELLRLTGIFVRSQARAAVIRHVGGSQELLVKALGGNVPGLVDEEGYPRGIVREVALEIVMANGLFAISNIRRAALATPELSQSQDDMGGDWRRENEYAIVSGNRMARMIELRVSAKE